MVESIHTRGQWTGIPSPKSVKKVKKRGANDGKKEFFKNFRRRYAGKEEQETDEQDLADAENKKKKAEARSEDEKSGKHHRKKDKRRGNKIDIRI
jgi:hypothetical protein